MKTTLKVLAVAGLCAFGGAASASPIYAPVDPSQIITYQGLDWAWASPCGDQANSCSSMDLSYQSTLGWRLPTATEVAAHIASNLTAFVDAFNLGNSVYACASAWFDNNYTHCDVGDAYQGYVWNLGNTGYDGFYSETFVVRGVSPVPVPAGLGLLAMGGVALAAVRRSRRKQA